MPEPVNEPSSREAELEYLEECRHEEDGVYWSIVNKVDDQLIGSIAISEINQHHGTGELGLVIGEREFWFKGIATEAIGLVCDYAKNQMKLRRLAAEYESGNEGVGKALEKNDFELEAIAKKSRMKQGKPIDTKRYFKLLK